MTAGAAADAGPAAVLGRVMLAFDGDRLPAWVAERAGRRAGAGMTVFRHHNVRSPGRFRELTEAFQAARAPPTRSRPAGSIAADQEGGQLQALGDGPTAFAGNMALGAIDDPALAERVGEAIGLEARAMGVNVVYAPVLDVASAPANAAIGIRSFGDDPARVAALGVAFLSGLRRAGVAAAVKHFPGLGDTDTDTHHALAVVRAAARAARGRGPAARSGPAIDAGVPMVMSSHVAVPALNDGALLASTLAPAVMTGLLRRSYGFGGVTISDALDMAAIAQGEAQADAVLAAVRAGVDLLLCGPDRDAQRRIEAALLAGARDGRIDPLADAAARGRIDALRRWLGEAGAPPDLAHRGRGGPCRPRARARRALADARSRRGAVAAARPVRGGDRPGRDADPDRPDPGRHVVDGHAGACRRPADAVRTGRRGRHGRGSERCRDRGDPRAGWARRMPWSSGTIDGTREPRQLALLEAVAAAAGPRPVVAVALRTPWDVARYPAGVAAVCTYSIHAASLVALAGALSGAIPFAGRLPVALDGGSAAARR